MRGVGPHASWKICDLQSSSLFLSLLLLLLLDVELSSTKGAPTQNSFNTSLIRNITKVLNTILLNQDKNFRPMNANPRTPLKVEIDISVRSMGPISEQRMEFSMDCYFRQKWMDRRLAFTPIEPNRKEIPLSSKMLKDIWTPDTYIRNGRKSYLHTITVPNVLFRVRSDGQVHVSQRLTIRARCPMFLRKFPMDAQACPIEIGSLGYFTTDVIYEWKGFYILQIYTPCTLLVVMSWVSFWINKEASPARVALGIMTVLSMSTLGFGLRTDLPKVSHSTALDIYIIICFGFVFAAMVEYAVINYAHIVYIRKKVHEMQGLESNRAIEKMRMFTGAMLGARRETLQGEDLTLAIKKTPWYRKLFRRDKKENTSDSQGAFHHSHFAMEESEDDEEDEIMTFHPTESRKNVHCNSQRATVFYRMAVKAAKAREKLKLRDPSIVVNRIDNISKIAFPSLYIFFNIIYWYAFLYWIPDEINELLLTSLSTSSL